jgi:hypothetical protein
MQHLPLNNSSAAERSVAGNSSRVRRERVLREPSHSASRRFVFKYDTTSGQITELVHELTDICGEDARTNPRARSTATSSRANGWLYMATHFAAEKPGVYETWTAHALGASSDRPLA